MQALGPIKARLNIKRTAPLTAKSIDLETHDADIHSGPLPAAVQHQPMAEQPAA
ncbi:expressed protein [Chlorella variabilis]|uniref:Expressed protein n=1 Tax=Chlorella variabilis TaxID=554065 RepID=E1Z9Q7_CHLVA|nr:expressed protein [Chlorella variabilis]EFN57566.1 expressed protein [Chlorella variabilis]|eukprot:XP_005849668.1 expressed protein [Chlorella variabilis]